jgi:SNF2 family DNA or RNA helicase
MLTLVTFLRQCLIEPLVPIMTLYLQKLEMKPCSDLYKFFEKNLDYDSFLPKKMEPSSRMVSIINVLRDTLEPKPGNKSGTRNPKIIIMTYFVNNITMIQYYIKELLCKKDSKKQLLFFTMDSSMNGLKRGSLIDDFTNCTEPCILFLPYKLGSEGLNLQCADTLLLTEYWWNCSTTKQSVSRLVRTGQDKCPNVYFFTSKTGIEYSILQKQNDKIKVIDELNKGPAKSNVHKINLDDIIRLTENNTELLMEIYE